MNKKIAAFLSITTVAAIIGLVVAVLKGAKDIPLETIFNSILHSDHSIDAEVVRNARIPRAICTALVGGFLGISGAMMQGVTRNPIAEPSLMGISQGATLAVAFCYTGNTILGLGGNTIAAFIGAILSGGLVLLFSMQNRRSSNLSRLLLAGTALSTFFISLATVIALLTNQSQNLAFWVAGGFRTADWNNVWLALILGGICVIAAFFLAPRINIVNLGEDVATGLGENPVKVRILTLCLIIPLSAVSVAIAGNIAFVGLIIPHIIRRIFGQDYRIIIPLSFLGGATLLIWSDIAARLVNMPYETPIGLFTSIIGVPFFLWMVRKETA
ncbi:ABC-type Fe3+-siderophore transport system, permease component [Lachnospiraceae bacterium KM106-2]|nr:ABC-type Fe3+-siderophore transport system, permease component [Lachnospiraceae bacterium KM106-2]